MLMRFGVYRNIKNGHLYQFLLIARSHADNSEVVVYIPLRIEPEWAGTVRAAFRPRAEFEEKFQWVGEGLPE
jgi:hypothetical protein